ncbi:RES family NAD+ phosphorylase [Guptibacillus spartinae]|uniref:RES family NAD+ phosphorylase n=1 Tax=Guptibacillus spartinae TaxID=3025679 RepID=UPI002362383A|nr:RES family NAD+ phosphorylase [Pseudalkalibacillus spartinae]
MICCTKCFKDPEIKAIIEGIGKKVESECDTCGKRNGYIYDTEENDELVDSFNGLLEIYTPESQLPDDFPMEKKYLLKNELDDRWNIFNIEKDKIYPLVKNICAEKYNETSDLFNTPISILVLNESDYLESNSLLKTNDWKSFVKEIKYHNRFNTNFINTNVLDIFCDYVKVSYKKEQTFYRARISQQEEGFSINEMGCPPIGKASDGRANPLGISYLYLSNNIDTTIHEIRAGTHDYITVGTFRLKRDIELIDFITLDKISPFSEIGLEQHAVNKEHLRKISDEIAKPLRRGDSVLDYLPTQYISDYLKSKGHEGIRYKSTMNPEGFNIAIFNPELFECIDVQVYDIKEVIHRKEKVVE